MTQSISQFIKWYRENEGKISKGPWDVRDNGREFSVHSSDFQSWRDEEDEPCSSVCYFMNRDYALTERSEVDSKFISDSRNTMPDIVAALEEIKTIIETGCALSVLSDQCFEWRDKYFPSEES